MNLDELKKDLDFLKDREVVIYGSFVTGEFRKGSDIDIAVITRQRDTDRNLQILMNFIGRAKPVYDIRIFELLPLKVKASLMSDYSVLYGDELELSEYFYQFRKEWDDQKHRILGGYHKDHKEKIEAMRSRR